MPYVFSRVATNALIAGQHCVEDLRMAPVRGRDTKFRLMQQNMLAYSFDSFVPGFAASSVLNDAPFKTVVQTPLDNADREGVLRFGADYTVNANAKAKVAGDIFEVVTHATLWNAAARWNGHMTGNSWPTAPRFTKPTIGQQSNRQVAVLNLPRGYDWVRLLVQSARDEINNIRAALTAQHDLSLPTSTPDIAVVVLPDAAEQANPLWRMELPDLQLNQQDTLRNAYLGLEGRIEPGEIVFALAVKRSLRSDRLYQPLYEANVMQLLLEGFLGAPRVEFEVQTLSLEGTAAQEIYKAASLYAVTLERQQLSAYAAGAQNAAGSPSSIHPAVRDLYIPASARELAQRLLAFLDTRMALVP